MSEIIYGSINYKERTYPFFLEGRRVNIVGTAWQFYDDFQNADYEEVISGFTSSNRQIMFLRCKFGRTAMREKVWFSPVGYILSRGNVGDPYDFTFEKLSFYSDAINSFFPPQTAIKTDLDPLNWNGRITLLLKPFEETRVSFVYKECECTLNISRYITTQSGKSDLGNLHSSFSFEFNTAQPDKELPQYWLALFDFLSFINYGTDIQFNKITLHRKRKDGLFKHCADAHIFSERGEYTPRPFPNAITVNDIPLEKLGTMFSKIASLRGNDERLPYYFPKNYREDRRIDAARWFVMAMNFDGLSTSCYPNFKQNRKDQFRTAKSIALGALNEVDQSAMSRKERDYFDDCYKELERYEGLLEEKFNYIVEKYHDALMDILEFNLQKHCVTASSYGRIYQEYRNKIAHGEIRPVGSNEEAVYRVIQALIYFMLLEDVGLDNSTLQTIAKKLFL